MIINKESEKNNMTKLRLWNQYSTKTQFPKLKCSICRKKIKLDENNISIELSGSTPGKNRYICMCKDCWLGDK